MECIREVSEDLYWVGAEDKKLKLFENIIPIPKGISYNSYLLMDEKVVLLDTVDYSVGKQFLENIKKVLNGRTIDFIVVNHMEPDHASIIEELTIQYPNMKIIGNTQTEKMLKQFFNFDVESKMQLVKEGDKILTGKHVLNFIFAPMVHWPEVMVTYDEYNKILFSADAFGTFGTLDGNLFNTDTDYEKVYLDEARRYYTNIVGKYGVSVQSLLKKVSLIDVKTICPLHGPIWKENLDYILNKYDKWSKYEPENKAVIILYGSIYGHTENVAKVLANYLGEQGVTDIKTYDVSHVDNSYLIAESFRCSNIVIASSTYNMGIFPKMDEYLSDIKRLNLQNRVISVIENSTWAPGLVINLVNEKLEQMKNISIVGKPLQIKSSIKNKELKELYELGNAIIDSI